MDASKGNGIRLFGTDGIRGIANLELTPELAMRVGSAAVKVLVREGSRPFLLLEGIPAFPAGCWNRPWWRASARPAAGLSYWE